LRLARSNQLAQCFIVGCVSERLSLKPSQA
jgi:hypothetical protein